MPTVSFPVTRRLPVILAVGIASVAGLALSGCESNAPALNVEQRAAMVPTQADEFAKLGYRVEWRGFANLLPGQHIEHLDIVGDALAVQDSAGALTILEPATGAIRWSDQVTTSLTRYFGSVRVGKTIVVSSEAQAYVYDAATGTLLRKASFEHVINTPPAVVGNILVYGTYQGLVFGHIITSGFQAWASSTSTTIEFPPVTQGKDGIVAVCSNAGDILILNGQNGEGQGRTKIYDGPGAGLASSDTTLFVASKDHSLYAISRNGSELWRYRTGSPLTQRPVYNEYKLYADVGPSDLMVGGKPAGGLTAFDAFTGKVLWANPAVSGHVVAIRKNKLVVMHDKTVWLLDPDNGVIVETVTLDNISQLVASKFVDGTLYAVSPLGVISKLSPK